MTGRTKLDRMGVDYECRIILGLNIVVDGGVVEKLYKIAYPHGYEDRRRNWDLDEDQDPGRENLETCLDIIGETSPFAWSLYNDNEYDSGSDKFLSVSIDLTSDDCSTSRIDSQYIKTENLSAALQQLEQEKAALKQIAQDLGVPDAAIGLHVKSRIY